MNITLIRIYFFISALSCFNSALALEIFLSPKAPIVMKDEPGYVKPPKKWNGLFCEEKRCQFRPVFLKIRKDEKVIANPNVRSSVGYIVSIEGANRPIVLIKDLGFQTKKYFQNARIIRKIKNKYPTVTAILNKEKTQKITYSLKTRGYDKKNMTYESIRLSYSVFVTPGDSVISIYKETNLHLYAEGNKRTIELNLFKILSNQLMWAGDMDLDGKMDYLFNFSAMPKSGQKNLQLFLSTHATGSTWKPAATFSYWDPNNPGC